MRIYLTRHGESEANVIREFSNRGAEHPLTSRGYAQMIALASGLTTTYVTRIYTSPLLRARQSAQILAQTMRAPVEVTEALREWDVGELEGRSDDEAWQRYFQLRKDWVAGHHDSRIEGGESLNDIKQRFVPFVRDLVASAAAGQQLLFVAHGGLYCAALPYLFGNVDPIFADGNAIDYASYIVGERHEGSLYCSQWGGLRFSWPPRLK